MIKKLLFYFLLLFCAVYLGVKFSGNPGYILFSYQNWSVEVSLWLATFFVFLVVFVFYSLFQISGGIRSVIENWRAWILRRREVRTQYLYQGLTALIGSLTTTEIEEFTAEQNHPSPVFGILSRKWKKRKGQDLREENWQLLIELLPQLRKMKILTQENFSALEYTVYHAVLSQAFCKSTFEEVADVWNGIPKYLCNDPGFLSGYCEFLIKNEQQDTAEHLLQTALKKRWDPRLVQCYGRVKTQKPLKQLALAKTWLKSHGDDPDLLLCLGRLSARHALWGQAKDYLQASISAGGDAEAHYELAKVLEQLGNQPAVLECYKKLAAQLFH